MGLSSDNMTTLKRIESLAGRPLSIMALAYVDCTTLHYTPHFPASHHKQKHWKRLQNTCLETSPLSWNVDTITVIQHTHTQVSSVLKRSQRCVFPFCLKKAYVRDRGTKEKWEGKGSKVTNRRTEQKAEWLHHSRGWLF